MALRLALTRQGTGRDRERGAMPESIRFYESVKYEFSEKELAEISQTLAAELSHLAELEHKKAVEASSYASAIKESRAKIDTLGQKVFYRFEMRELEVTTMLDEPVEGMKRIIDTATGEVIREVEMSRDEKLQRRLDFEGGNT
jgi:serine phosphatase RsbU (regulator of sigma subunit)